MTENKQNQSWYVMVTKKEQEKAACQNLERKGFICYVPQSRKLLKGQLQDGVTLFPDRIFVWCTPAELAKILEQKYITHVLYFGNEPARINQDAVEMLQTFTALYENIQLEHALVDAEALPTLSSAPLHGLDKGTVDRPYELLRLSLPCLGAVLVAEGPASASTPATSSRSSAVHSSYKENEA